MRGNLSFAVYRRCMPSQWRDMPLSLPTLSDFRDAPSKPTGARRVGGTPAWAPVVATVTLLFRRKLKRACTWIPSTLTTDSGRLSMLTARGRWLRKLVRELLK